MPAPRRLRALTTITVIGAGGLLAACIPPPAAMPMVKTTRVDVPAIPLAAVPNIALDAATFDAAAAAACVTGGVAATTTGFYGSELGRWSALRLANETTTLVDQQHLLGNLFTAGFFGGRHLATTHPEMVDLLERGPFAAMSDSTKAASTIVLNQLAGQMLAAANGDGVAAATAALAPLLGQAVAALNRPADPSWPADVASLAAAVRDVANAVSSAATGAAGGDLAAARRTEAAMAGLLVWAGGFAMGVAGQLPVGDPSLTC